MAVQQDEAKKAEKRYAQLNFHHDQFDGCEAALTVAVALLAITALTGTLWLYCLALFPACLGILMGVAGLCHSSFNVAILTKFLGA